MTLEHIMQQLADLGTEQTKKTLQRHGVPDPLFGVRIGDTKKHLLKQVKHNHELALALFATGNYDAQYLAGLSINPKLISQETLQQWAHQASCLAINQAIVATVTAESPFALTLARDWLKSETPLLVKTGWSCYGNYLSLAADHDIDANEVEELLAQVVSTIWQVDDDLRYTMNRFIITVGTYFLPLKSQALAAAQEIGSVTVTYDNVSCKVPSAFEKIRLAPTPAKKRRRAVC